MQDLCDAKAVMFNICSLLASRLAFATTFLIDDSVDEIAVCFTLNILQSHWFFSSVALTSSSIYYVLHVGFHEKFILTKHSTDSMFKMVASKRQHHS